MPSQNGSKRLRHERQGDRSTASISIISPPTRVESTMTILTCRRPHLTQSSSRTLLWLCFLWAALAIEGSSSYPFSTTTCHAQCAAATAAFHFSRSTATTRVARTNLANAQTCTTSATALHTVAHGAEAALAPLHATSSTDDTTRQRPTPSRNSRNTASASKSRRVAETMGLWCETQVQGLTERLTGSTVRPSLSQRYFGNQPFAMTYTDPSHVHKTLFRLADDDLGEAENEITNASPTTLSSAAATPRQDSPTTSGEQRSWFQSLRRRRDDNKQSSAARLIDDQRQVWEALNSLEKDSTYLGY
jgi:hypothetical protein